MAVADVAQRVAGVRDGRRRVAISGGYIVQGLCFAALLTQVPVLQERYGVTDAQLPLVLAAVPVVAGLGSVLAGMVAERLGSAVVLRVAQPLVCLAVLGAGVMPDRLGLYGVLVVFGLAVGAVDASMNMQGVSLERQYGRSILASFHATWSAAGIAGALISSGTNHWRLPVWAGFGVVAVLGIGVSLVGGPRLLSRDAERRLAPAPGAGAAVPWRPIVLIGVAVTLMYVADSATSNYSAVYLKHALSSGATFAPWGYAAYQGCMLAGRLVADPAVRRWGAAPAVRFGAAVAVAALGLVVAAPNAAAAIAGFGLLGAGLCAVVPQSFSAAGRYDPTGSGVAIARVNIFNYVGFLLGAPIVGLVNEAADWRTAFAVPLVLVALIIPLGGSFRARG